MTFCEIFLGFIKYCQALWFLLSKYITHIVLLCFLPYTNIPHLFIFFDQKMFTIKNCSDQK